MLSLRRKNERGKEMIKKEIEYYEVEIKFLIRKELYKSDTECLKDLMINKDSLLFRVTDAEGWEVSVK